MRLINRTKWPSFVFISLFRIGILILQFNDFLSVTLSQFLDKAKLIELN